jgi:GxxExxY protein
MNREDLEAREAREAHEADWRDPKRDEVTNRVIGLAIKVHRTVGPGLFEQVYEDYLGFELERAGLRFQRQVKLPLIYEGMRFERGYRAYLTVQESVLLEIK